MKGGGFAHKDLIKIPGRLADEGTAGCQKTTLESGQHSTNV